MPNFAIIVAAGSGQRMNNSLPKQFHLLDGLPVLMRTIHAFFRANGSKPEIVVVLAAEWMDYWTDLCYKFQFHVPHFIVEGGSSRFKSVRNGLDFIVSEKLAGDEMRADSVIAVHDGARPLVSPSLIDETFEVAARNGAVVPGISSADSVRYAESGSNKALPRDQVYLIQTPQTFRAAVILNAYLQEESPLFTDDASVVEANGTPVTLIEGDKTNLKITTETDLAVAAVYLQQ